MHNQLKCYQPVLIWGAISIRRMFMAWAYLNSVLARFLASKGSKDTLFSIATKAGICRDPETGTRGFNNECSSIWKQSWIKALRGWVLIVWIYSMYIAASLKYLSRRWQARLAGLWKRARQNPSAFQKLLHHHFGVRRLFIR